VYRACSAFDFMGYPPLYDGSRAWVSPYTYMGLLDAIISRFGVTYAELVERDGAMREMLHLKFRMYRDGTVELQPSFHLLGLPPPSLTRTETQHSIRCELVDASGTVLASERCDPADPHQDPDGPHLDFSVVMPWFDDARTLAFVRDGQVVHTTEIEVERLTVTIDGPRGSLTERVAVTWKAHQPDRRMRYMLRYSHDGGRTWRVIAPNAPEDGVEFDPTRFPGGDRCLLQIVASSGIRTAVSESDPFSVPVKPRRAFILSPEAGIVVSEGDAITFLGGGFSPDFGVAEMEDTLWTSNIDGILGTGWEVITPTMSPGLHLITLTISDGIEARASAAITVEVKPMF
jgi:hypothetical protein